MKDVTKQIKEEKLKYIDNRDYNLDSGNMFVSEYEELFKSRRIYGTFGSKSRYIESNPTHNVYFNARICIKGKYYEHVIASCDIDINKQVNKLQNICNKLNTPLYIIAESISWKIHSFKDLTEDYEFFKFIPTGVISFEEHYEELLELKEDTELNIYDMTADIKYMPLTLLEHNQKIEYQKELDIINDKLENKKYFELI